MGLFGWFGKSPKQKEAEESERRARAEDLEIYSGMRVEVTTEDGRMFLTARLVGLRGDRAQLQPETQGNLLTETEKAVPVTLRGYSSKENKAVVMQADIRLGANNVWQAEHITLVKAGNDRTFFRMDTNVEALVIPEYGEEETCKLINISVGGACIGSRVRRNVGDKYLMRVKLLPEAEQSELRCQILRIIERRHDYFEYGCKFLNLREADENHILQIIFDMQRKKRMG